MMTATPYFGCVFKCHIYCMLLKIPHIIIQFTIVFFCTGSSNVTNILFNLFHKSNLSILLTPLYCQLHDQPYLFFKNSVMQWVFIMILLLFISHFNVLNSLYEGHIYVYQISPTKMHVFSQLLWCIPPQDHIVHGIPS